MFAKYRIIKLWTEVITVNPKAVSAIASGFTYGVYPILMCMGRCTGELIALFKV